MSSHHTSIKNLVSFSPHVLPRIIFPATFCFFGYEELNSKRSESLSHTEMLSH